MGIESITDYTRPLGLGTSTGIELGEEIGTVADPDFASSWGAGNDVSAAIGQSDHAYTPLQLSVYMSSIANGGTRYGAHLLDSVRSFYSKDIIESHVPTVLDRVEFSSSTLDVLREGMRRVVYNNDEIKWRFQNVPVTVGGKTGTAEIGGKLDTALFSGFAPLDDPEIVVTCVIEEGLHGYYASSAVAKVMEEYFKNNN
jgi:penicillin-binding protein 2